MGKEIVNQVQEAQRVPGRINPRRNTPRHIVVKLTEIKDRVKIYTSEHMTKNWGSANYLDILTENHTPNIIKYIRIKNEQQRKSKSKNAGI